MSFCLSPKTEIIYSKYKHLHYLDTNYQSSKPVTPYSIYVPITPVYEKEVL